MSFYAPFSHIFAGAAIMGALACGAAAQAALPRGPSIASNYLGHGRFEDLPADLRAHMDVQPLAQGFLDVAKPPYSAARDGRTDATAAIQRAIDDAYRHRFSVFFPEGVYLVSSTLRCVKPNSPRTFPKKNR